ncbi:TniQ family protein [Nocardia farcinica]|uniref:TniQ family protein n=1 Tax=Nocardia farcinica TaxID=37329 RepID=UPI001895734A|nr:TniQ family protein [Nocardia farcinica]MBF6234847.1 TniQ family protein [Nocardia farcinica]MBF6257205.1 TniQ family protein [Nocardia farcinica]MBF6265554.1 TniQ family protein [Nocardia farcinica]MBF6271277.1 TniQ family protein [Nocardia farcinica]MBF6422758.1 TniQ family protein [Nocardia farcinica]
MPRWPVHPRPGPIESLSSWLERLAMVYHLPVKVLLEDLCADSGLNIRMISSQVHDPPRAILVALADRTGVPVPRLATMTLSGWVPWLVDKQWPRDFEQQEMFDNYVGRHSVLLLPGTIDRDIARRTKSRWDGPWLPYPRRPRACPVCATDPDSGRALVWDLPLMISCVTHRCRLERAGAVAIGDIAAPAAVDETVTTMDGYTYQALTTGLVRLPGRTVHAGVWFRLLRCLLEELCISRLACSARTGATLETIWETIELPMRGRIAMLEPYECLDPETQETLLRAAALALRLAALRRIPALGEFGPALVPARCRPGSPGNSPVPPYAPPRRHLLNPPRWWPAAPVQAGPPRDWSQVARRYALERGFPAWVFGGLTDEPGLD